MKNSGPVGDFQNARSCGKKILVPGPFTRGNYSWFDFFGSKGDLVIEGGKLFGAKAGEDQIKELPIPEGYTKSLSGGDPRLQPVP